MSDEVRVTHASGAEKGSKLARFDLIPAAPLWQLAELYGKGAQKYADRNWERGYDWHLSFAALQRHAWLFWSGEDVDEHKPECPPDCAEHTECAHLASVAWHALALLEWSRTHPENDDRPTSR